MANLLNDLYKTIQGLGDSAGNTEQDIKNKGFTIPKAPNADGIGLPYTNIPAGISPAQPVKRHLIHWLVPDMGVIKMYINPENITYSYKKLINPQRTKNGYVVQYWGEDLIKIRMSGTTGSSGIEGINVLYEIYRSEQYTFDSVGLTLAASSPAASIANSLVGGLGALVGSGFSTAYASSTPGASLGSELAQGLFGADQSNNLSPRNIPTLAYNAFTVEMYYNGWVFRGYFDDINITETTDLLFSYSINFTATQRRGYRTNFLPWHKNPNGGGGDNSNDTNLKVENGLLTGYNGVPYSFGSKFTAR